MVGSLQHIRLFAAHEERSFTAAMAAAFLALLEEEGRRINSRRAFLEPDAAAA